MVTTLKSPGAPGVSLSYVTIGAILSVLAGTSYVFFSTSSWHPVLGYVRMCALILGLVFLAIGFGVGRIGQVSGETEKVTTTDPVTVAVPPTSAGNGTATTNPVYTTTTSRGV